VNPPETACDVKVDITSIEWASYRVYNRL